MVVVVLMVVMMKGVVIMVMVMLIILYCKMTFHLFWMFSVTSPHRINLLHSCCLFLQNAQ